MAVANRIKEAKKKKYSSNKLFYCKYFLFCIILYFLFFNCFAFNIDTKNVQIHRRGSTGFGYSVDFAYATERRDKFTYVYNL